MLHEQIQAELEEEDSPAGHRQAAEAAAEAASAASAAAAASAAFAASPEGNAQAAAARQRAAAEQRRQAAANAEDQRKRAEAAARAKLPGVRIGDTAQHVLERTHWGKPYRVRTRTEAGGTFEVWEYGPGQWLELVNGRVHAIVQ